MKLTDGQLATAKQLAQKDEVVKALLEFYDYITTNSMYEGYVSRKVTLSRWDKDLIENPVNLFSLQDDEEAAKARDKEVDRVLKYLEKQTILYKQTEEMFSSLTKDEITDLNKDKRIRESEDRAFKARV